MRLILFLISLGNFIIVAAGMATALYGQSALGIVVGPLVALMGFKNIWYVRISSNLVLGFYYSGDWRRKPKRKVNEVIDQEMNENNHRTNFLPLMVMGSLALLESFLFLILFLLVFYNMFYDIKLVKAALGSLLLLSYAYAMCRYVYWNFRAIRFIRAQNR